MLVVPNFVGIPDDVLHCIVDFIDLDNLSALIFSCKHFQTKLTLHYLKCAKLYLSTNPMFLRDTNYSALLV